MPMAKIDLKYFSNLDGLRGIAAFSVLIFHFFHEPAVTTDIYNIELAKRITDVLQHGVTLFFVLSGFVITRILLNNKSDENFFRSFYKRRALRIFPLYYLYLIVHFYVLPAIIGSGPNLDLGKQIPVFFYLQNMSWLTGYPSNGPGHFWSLAVEEHFYLLWPLFIWIFPKNRITFITYFLLFLSIPIKLYFIKNNIDINYNSFSRYDSILVGSLIALFERRQKFSLPNVDGRFYFGLVFIIFLCMSLYVYQDLMFIVKSTFKHVIMSIFAGLLIYFLISNSNNNSYINYILKSGAFQYFGKISYGIYVWHMMAITIVSQFHLQNFIINLIITFLITILLAVISYSTVEKPFLKFK
jgi:peptidoglycan/LPS O-acetylase OafA/YrhL